MYRSNWMPGVALFLCLLMFFEPPLCCVCDILLCVVCVISCADPPLVHLHASVHERVACCAHSFA